MYCSCSSYIMLKNVVRYNQRRKKKRTLDRMITGSNSVGVTRLPALLHMDNISMFHEDGVLQSIAAVFSQVLKHRLMH